MNLVISNYRPTKKLLVRRSWKLGISRDISDQRYKDRFVDSYVHTCAQC